MQADFVIFQVKITPKAARNAIVGWQPDLLGESVLKVTITAIPEDGKANAALIKVLSEATKRPKSDISIERGHTSRTKLIKIKGISCENLHQKIK